MLKLAVICCTCSSKKILRNTSFPKILAWKLRKYSFWPQLGFDLYMGSTNTHVNTVQNRSLSDVCCKLHSRLLTLKDNYYANLINWCLVLKFLPMFKLEAIFWTDFERSTSTRVNMVIILVYLFFYKWFFLIILYFVHQVNLIL